jgi:hypothetical protein
MYPFVGFLLLALASSAALSAPYVVSGPLDPRATHCGWKLDAGARTDVVVHTVADNKVCRLDLAGLPVGSHTVSATAVAIDPIWGRMESVPSANFTFAVPGLPSAPIGLGLKP